MRDHVGEGVWVGAGTVRTSEQLRGRRRSRRGLRGQPGPRPRDLGAALAGGLPFLPGAATPTEADAASARRGDLREALPGSSLGPSHVRELRGPLPEIETVVTGGVDPTNALRSSRPAPWRSGSGPRSGG